MSEYIRETTLKRDLDTFKRRQNDIELKRLYSLLPRVSCNSCGRCCYDPPVCTYVEFLNSLNYMISLCLNKSSLVELYKRILRYKIMSLIEVRKCPFQDNFNRCIIYQTAPLSCKRWGLQSEPDYKRDLVNARNISQRYKDYYRNLGVIIPPERLKYTTKYCDKVVIVEGQKGDEIPFGKLYFQVENLTKLFAQKNKLNSGVADYFADEFFGTEEIFRSRIQVIKSYQSGNSHAVELFINGINYEKMIDDMDVFIT